MRQLIVAIFILVSIVGLLDCVASFEQAATVQERPMSSKEVMKAIREHDWDIVARPLAAPVSLADEIGRDLPQLDNESKEIAVATLEHIHSPTSSGLLLRMTGDSNLQVAAAAARTLLRVLHIPPVDDILAAISQRENDFVRGRLYLLAGRANEAGKLQALRALVNNEKNPDSALDAQAAMVKLGGEPERAAFLERIRTARPDQATRASDHLLYINDSRLAKGMIPWLSNKSPVFRLGTDRDERAARMCDLAVYTAHQLGIKFYMEPQGIANFEASIIANAEKAVLALPD